MQYEIHFKSWVNPLLFVSKGIHFILSQSTIGLYLFNVWIK